MFEAEFLTNYKTCYNITFNNNCKIGTSWADELAKLYDKKSDMPKLKKNALKPKM
jgi:hypothetical protein